MLVHITLDNGATLSATAGHALKTPQGWRDAIVLKRGGQLLLKGAAEADDGGPAALRSVPGPEGAAERAATIVEVRTEQVTVRVFNLEVANAHTFFVGDEGYLAHNARSPTSGETGATRGGRDFHNPSLYPYPPGYNPEQTIPGAGRADAINDATRRIRERKYTDNPRTIGKAIKQVKRYCKKKPGYRGEVETMSPTTGETTVFSVL